jgi:hypothetical protein
MLLLYLTGREEAQHPSILASHGFLLVLTEANCLKYLEM